MKAMVLTAYKKLEILEVPKPVPQADEVLIRVKACGICGSDIYGYDGSTGRRQPPVIMGHEAAGVIEELGSAVTGWKVGERVTFDSTIFCGACRYCLEGFENLCDNRRVLGVSCNEYKKDGAFAEYIVVPQRILYHIPDNVSFEQATIVEPLSVAFHAVNLTNGIMNRSAVVVGTGMVGLLLIQALRAAGFGMIIAVDTHKDRLATALANGADEIMLSNGRAPGKIKALTNGIGVDTAFEVVGSDSSLNLAINSVRKGGTVTVIGNLAARTSFPLQSTVTRQLKIQGSCASNGEYPACLDMMARGSVNVDVIISQVAPLEEGPQWFEKLYNREVNMLKVVLTP